VPFVLRHKYRLRFPEVWKVIGPMHMATMWETDIWDVYRRIDGAYVVRRNAKIIARYWRPFDAKMAVREDIWYRYRDGATTGHEFTSFVLESHGVPDEPMYRSWEELKADSWGQGLAKAASGLALRLTRQDRYPVPETLPVPPEKNWKNRLAKLFALGDNGPRKASAGLTPAESEELGMPDFESNDAESCGSQLFEEATPETLKEIFMATATKSAPKKGSKDKGADKAAAAKRMPNSATADEIQAAINGTLKPRETAGSKDQESLTAVGENGRFKGRPLGVRHGLPVFLTCCYLLQQNQKAQKKDRLTDDQLAAELKKEFPGRETAWFDDVTGWRRAYNEGRFTKGSPVKNKSQMFDSNGDVTEPKRGRRGGAGGGDDAATNDPDVVKVSDAKKKGKKK
jgi:hypothetical protein